MATRRAKDDLPEHGDQWITDEIRSMLAALPDPWAAKKRKTVIRLAFAMAGQEPLKPVFALPGICSEVTWYGKWRFDPAIRAAFDACYKRALEWQDEQTAAKEAHYRRKKRENIAKYAAQAPLALSVVMASQEQRGADRINAALALIKLDDPATVKDAGMSPAMNMEQSVLLGAMKDDTFTQLLANLEAASGTGAADEEDAGPDDADDMEDGGAAGTEAAAAG